MHTNQYEAVDFYNIENPPPKPYGHYARFGFHTEGHRLSVIFANADRHDTRRADEFIKARTRRILGEPDA